MIKVYTIGLGGRGRLYSNIVKDSGVGESAIRMKKNSITRVNIWD